jgi:D-sedoheptulose 7-phosphate isomerase
LKRTIEAIEQSISVKQSILTDEDILSTIDDIVSICVTALKNGNKILFCGNGGSAADAQHLAAELSGKFYFDRPPLAAESLTVNTSYLTAISNDFSFNEIFSRLIEGNGKKGDILFGISTSGNSENIIKAFQQCKKQGIITIGLTGESGGKLKDFSNFIIKVPSIDTPRIQESHIMIGHIICEQIEKIIFNF